MYSTTITGSEPVDHAGEAREHSLLFEQHIINKYGKDLYAEQLIGLFDRFFQSEINNVRMLHDEISKSGKLMTKTLSRLEEFVPKS